MRCLSAMLYDYMEGRHKDCGKQTHAHPSSHRPLVTGVA